MDFDTDILIAGAGPAGLAAACVLGDAGHRILLVDPAQPVTGEDEPGADLRTTAVLHPAHDLLAKSGVWSAEATGGTPLRTMRIVDASGKAQVSRDFEAEDVSDGPFGWNIPNWKLRRDLLARVITLPSIETRFGMSVGALFARDAGARVTLSDGTRIAARLVLACDGRDSPLRAMAGIGTRRTDYRQTALVFAVTHDRPHDDISTEVHRDGGPFTLVPLPDKDGAHRSAVVWMDATERQMARMELDDVAFAAEVQARSADVMGVLRPVTGRSAWPIVSILADRFAACRLALVAEAAHAMPPIGAQGLNTSLRDIACLRDLAATHPLGGAAMLQAYDRARRRDVMVRMAGVDLLNRSSIAGFAPFQALRAAGVAALHDIAPLRRRVMRLGLGLS